MDEFYYSNLTYIKIKYLFFLFKKINAKANQNYI